MKQPSRRFVRGALLRRRLHVVALVGALSLFAACTGDNSQLQRGNPDEDTGVGQPDVDQPDVGQPDADPSAKRATQQLCASGGSTQGGGYSITHCTGPSEPASDALSGGGYRIELGAFRAIVPE